MPCAGANLGWLSSSSHLDNPKIDDGTVSKMEGGLFLF